VALDRAVAPQWLLAPSPSDEPAPMRPPKIPVRDTESLHPSDVGAPLTLGAMYLGVGLFSAQGGLLWIGGAWVVCSPAAMFINRWQRRRRAASRQ
jgi:hypothetical protein